MLRELKIENLAIIDELDIEFDKGFIVSRAAAPCAARPGFSGQAPSAPSCARGAFFMEGPATEAKSRFSQCLQSTV